jgi:oligopeptide transport system ATP-binding protein
MTGTCPVPFHGIGRALPTGRKGHNVNEVLFSGKSRPVGGKRHIQEKTEKMPPLLEVIGLTTHFITYRGQRVVKAVDGLSFRVNKGETVALIGESGCGKTTTSLSIVRILPPAARIVAGKVILDGESLLEKSPEYMCRMIRGKKVSMIPQDPMSSLDPIFTIGDQIAESLRLHQNLRSLRLVERMKELLCWVKISAPESRLKQYPHQFSGGMRQRVVGAISLAGMPKLLIADEPTTNLDVTIQAQYLALLQEIQRKTGLGILFITHNLGIVAKLCTYVVVMYAGKAVEKAPTIDLFDQAVHPYSRALIMAIPRMGSKQKIVAIEGQPPDLANLPPGCSFHPRCPDKLERCVSEEPPEIKLGPSRYVRCWRVQGG